MDVEWRKAVRRTAGLPRQTRSVLLPGLAGNENFLSQRGAISDEAPRVEQIRDSMRARGGLAPIDILET